jgi:uncharacterized membrane-anchored protein
VEAKIAEMKQAGNTPGEIAAAIAAMFRAWGVATTGEKGPGQGEPAWMQQLTPDQRAQVVAKIQELKQAGDTPEQIRALITEMLQGWGIQVPAAGAAGAGAAPAAAGQAKAQTAAGGNGPAWLAKLTPEQRQQVMTTVQQLRAAGKTQPEIRAAVVEMLKGWGIQAPAPEGNAGVFEKLTPEQRQQVQATIQELQADGSTPEQIRGAVGALLKGWGLQLPAATGGAAAAPATAQAATDEAWMAELTPEQRQQVDAKVQELRQAGKTPEEIRTAVGEMLKAWGIQPPAGGQHGELKALLQQLTPAQREQVEAKIKEMKEQGKTPAEIHAAVLDMLKAWGIQVPAPAPAAPK